MQAMMHTTVISTILAVFGLVSGSTFSPAKPPAIPLAVKSPYMNSWLEGGSDGLDGGLLPGHWPKFWAAPQPGAVVGSTGSVTGWSGMIRVDGTTYTWMGIPQSTSRLPPTVTQQSCEYTSQRTTFIMNVANKLSMNITFISPLTPTDLQRQSIIGTYLDVSVTAIDGATHSVQIYADISAEWVSIHNGDDAQWNYTVSNGLATHRTWRQTQSQFNVDYADDAAHWGYWYWSTAAISGLTYQSGQDVMVRGNFLDNGSLPDTQDSEYRPINSRWPVFAFSHDLGVVSSRSQSILFTLTHAQQNAINFDGANGLSSTPSLWTSYFPSDAAMNSFFYHDYINNTGQLDHKIAIDSIVAGGQDYLTITSLSARQAFAGTQLAGTSAKPYLFLKEISSDGNIQTVDVIFPSIPVFLYTNPVLLKYLLDPLFENQEAGQFPQTYSIHDLGANYPRAVGHVDGGGEYMPLEECGNMVIMTLAYAQRANDTPYLKQHYSILKQWSSYLIQEALIPAGQVSTDDFQGSLANQTNLALKGIIAIEAMAVIAATIGNTADASTFSSTAHSYIQQWQTLGIASSASPAHTTLNYGNNNTHGLLYNLYSDRLLGTNLVPQSVYDMQSAFYPIVSNTYGVQLDTRNNNTKSDWQMWTAAIASASTKAMFISKLAHWINTTSTNRAFTDLYNVQSADFGTSVFVARPVVGGHFAVLALTGALPSNE